MTIVMEMGLIHPPVGLNLFVIQQHRARHPAARRDPRRAAVRGADVPRDLAAVLRARHRDGIAGPDHGARSRVRCPALRPRRSHGEALHDRALGHAASIARDPPRARAAARRRQARRRRAGHRPARGADRVGRPRLPRRQQPEAGRLPREGARGGRHDAGARPAHAAVGDRAARTPRPVRERRRGAPRLLVQRAAGRADGAAGRREEGGDRRDPHLSRTVRAATSST